MNMVRDVLTEVKKAVSGKDQVLLWIFAAILARGHILLEDVPGVGKTTIALAFSRVLGLDYGRVQFNPDVLPSDITGYGIYDKASGTMRYQKGAVLCNLFLADELNRATSRTQSALLEAMEEGQVTVDGVSHKLPEPFTVIATQNPTDAAGTQLLPDSQMDRFTIRLSVGYPDRAAERAMVLSRLESDPLKSLRTVADSRALTAMQNETAQVYVKDEIIDYIISLVSATREHSFVSRGASPRATLSVTAMARAVAYAQGRDFVTPKDVETVYSRTLSHRLLLSGDARAQGLTAGKLLAGILQKTPAPRL